MCEQRRPSSRGLPITASICPLRQYNRGRARTFQKQQIWWQWLEDATLHLVNPNCQTRRKWCALWGAFFTFSPLLFHGCVWCALLELEPRDPRSLAVALLHFDHLVPICKLSENAPDCVSPSPSVTNTPLHDLTGQGAAMVAEQQLKIYAYIHNVPPLSFKWSLLEK